MFPSHVIQLLDGCDAPKFDICTSPNVEKCEEVQSDRLDSGRNGINENSSPFRFTPQRIRLDKDDQLFEDGDVQRHLYLQQLTTTFTDEPQAPLVSEFRCHISGCKQLFDTLDGYEHHYNSLHRHMCSNCKRSFPSNRLLDIHILEWHDSFFLLMAEKQCMYQCLVEGCGLKFKTSNERKDHLISAHRYPSDFRFNRSKIKRAKEQKTAQQKEACFVVPGKLASQQTEPDNCESMDISLTRDTVGQEIELSAKQKPRYAYKVPPSICFGQGSVRGFRGGRRKK